MSDTEKHFELVAAEPANEAFHKNRTFEQWGQFLVNAGYVEFVEASDPPQAQITPFGRQFLQWMVIAGVSEFKPS